MFLPVISETSYDVKQWRGIMQCLRSFYLSDGKGAVRRASCMRTGPEVIKSFLCAVEHEISSAHMHIDIKKCGFI